MKLLLVLALASCSSWHAVRDRSVPSHAIAVDGVAALALGAAAVSPAITPDPRVAHAAMAVAMAILLTDMIVLWATGAE